MFSNWSPSLAENQHWLHQGQGIWLFFILQNRTPTGSVFDRLPTKVESAHWMMLSASHLNSKRSAFFPLMTVRNSRVALKYWVITNNIHKISFIQKEHYKQNYQELQSSLRHHILALLPTLKSQWSCISRWGSSTLVYYFCATVLLKINSFMTVHNLAPLHYVFNVHGYLFGEHTYQAQQIRDKGSTFQKQRRSKSKCLSHTGVKQK